MIPLSKSLGFIIYFFWLFYIFSLLIKNFFHCPYPDFLSWDGNLRAITSIKILSSLRFLEFTETLRLILDTPTWPILRNLLQILLYSFTGENGTVDTLLTTGMFFLFLALLPLLYLEYTKNIYLSIFLSFLASIAFILSDSYILYAFSPMLEVQGSIVTLLFIYFFHKYCLNRINFGIPLLFAFLSLLTKYPYGYLLILFLIFFLIIFYPEDVYHLIKFFIDWIKENKIYLISILILFIFFGISFFPFPGKLSFYLRYMFLLGIVFVLFLYLKEDLRVSGKIREISLYFILPMILFIISHPDRVSSTSGTISHTQVDGVFVGSTFIKDWHYYSIFFKTLFFDMPGIEYLGFFLSFIFLSGLAPLFYRSNLSEQSKILDKYPHFLYSIFIISSILGLTLLTPNHQSRHVYHLFPSLVFCSTLILINFIYYIQSNYLKIVRLRDALLPFIFLIFFSPLLFKLYYKLITNFSTTYLCYGGIIDIYNTPLELQQELPGLISANTVLLNGIEENNLNRADVELIFSREAFKQNIRFGIGEKEFLNNSNIYKSSILVSKTCNEDKRKYIKDKTIFYFLREEREIQKQNICITIYSKLP